MRNVVLLGVLLGVACSSTDDPDPASCGAGTAGTAGLAGAAGTAGAGGSGGSGGSAGAAGGEPNAAGGVAGEAAGAAGDAGEPNAGAGAGGAAGEPNAAGAAGEGGAPSPVVSIPPFPAGTYAVAMSNFELSAEAAALPAATIGQYMEGAAENAGYVAELFESPETVLTVDVTVPETSLYGELAGTTVSVAYYVAYPTQADNSRETYLFPYPDAYEPGFVHMDRPGDAPLFSEAHDKYPVIVSSHGYATHALWDVNRAKVLASHGYIVVMPFHGDMRFAPLDDTTLPVRALRPLQTKAVIDDLLASAYGPFVDVDRIGVSGHSFGAVSTLALMGGDIGLDERTVHDARVRAGIGASPYLGASYESDFYQFGPQNSGLSSVAGPFLCIYGSADDVAPPEYTLEAIEHLEDATYVVEFVDQPHVYTGGFWDDRENWELLFYAAYLQDDADALELLKTGDSISGFGEDHQHFELQKP